MRQIRPVKISAILAGKIILTGVLANSSAAANDFTAEKVMKHMSSEERYGYLAGVIEGLAVARYYKDAKNKTGMNCIYDWFYDDKNNLRVIYDNFEKYPAYPPGSIIDVLTKQKCGG